jgi:hypothetical protein
MAEGVKIKLPERDPFDREAAVFQLKRKMEKNLLDSQTKNFERVREHLRGYKILDELNPTGSYDATGWDLSKLQPKEKNVALKALQMNRGLLQKLPGEGPVVPRLLAYLKYKTPVVGETKALPPSWEKPMEIPAGTKMAKPATPSIKVRASGLGKSLLKMMSPTLSAIAVGEILNPPSTGPVEGTPEYDLEMGRISMAEFKKRLKAEGRR